MRTSRRHFHHHHWDCIYDHLSKGALESFSVHYVGLLLRWSIMNIPRPLKMSALRCWELNLGNQVCLETRKRMRVRDTFEWLAPECRQSNYRLESETNLVRWCPLQEMHFLFLSKSWKVMKLVLDEVLSGLQHPQAVDWHLPLIACQILGEVCQWRTEAHSAWRPRRCRFSDSLIRPSKRIKLERGNLCKLHSTRRYVFREVVLQHVLCGQVIFERNFCAHISVNKPDYFGSTYDLGDFQFVFELRWTNLFALSS